MLRLYSCLMHHHRSGLFPGRAHQQNERKHRQKHDGEQPEDVVERHDGGLLPDDVFNHAICHPLSGCGIRAPLRHHHAFHPIHESLRLKVARGDVGCKRIDVYLGVSGLYGLNHRDPDARADVPHQIEDAGSVPHSFQRDRVIRDRRKWNEYQSHSDSLPDECPEEIPIADIHREVGKPPHRERSEQHSADEKIMRLHLGEQRAYHRHCDERS